MNIHLSGSSKSSYDVCCYNANECEMTKLFLLQFFKQLRKRLYCVNTIVCHLISITFFFYTLTKENLHFLKKIFHEKQLVFGSETNMHTEE